MKFCTECGGALAKTWVEADGRDRLACVACKAVSYQNPRILLTCLVECEDRLLMCQRRHEPSRGLWTPPAGFMEQGETLEQAAARETFEEAGVVVDASRLDLYTISNVPWMSEVYVGFRTSVASPDVRVGDESLDARFMTEAEIPWDQLAFPETKGYLRLYFHERSAGRFGIHLTNIDSTGGYRRTYQINGVRDVFEAHTPTSRQED